MKKWEIDNIEELSEKEQKEYLEKLKEKYNHKKNGRKKVWEALFAAAAIGIVSGVLLIAIGGDAYNVPGTAAIISSTVAELGISFGALMDVSNIELEAKTQIAEAESKINKKR